MITFVYLTILTAQFHRCYLYNKVIHIVATHLKKFACSGVPQGSVVKSFLLVHCVDDLKCGINSCHACQQLYNKQQALTITTLSYGSNSLALFDNKYTTGVVHTIHLVMETLKNTKVFEKSSSSKVILAVSTIVDIAIKNIPN